MQENDDLQENLVEKACDSEYENIVDFEVRGNFPAVSITENSSYSNEEINVIFYQLNQKQR